MGFKPLRSIPVARLLSAKGNDMKLQSFQMQMGPEEARAKALKQAGPLGKLMLSKDQDIHMRTVFIENKIITYQITNEPSLLSRLLRKKQTAKHKSKIRVIANGSTSGVSYYDGIGVDLVEADVPEEQIQRSDYPDEKLISKGNVLARRILRRRIGGNISIEPIEVESVYRPYHVAFFGEPVEGTKVRYLPIAADGCSVKRTC